MATLEKTDAVEFATQFYNEQQDQIKQNYIESLAVRLMKSIEQGERDIEDGNMLTMEDFKKQLYAIEL